MIKTFSNKKFRGEIDRGGGNKHASKAVVSMFVTSYGLARHAISRYNHSIEFLTDVPRRFFVMFKRCFHRLWLSLSGILFAQYAK